MKDLELTNPIDIKLAALVARKKAKSNVSDQMIDNKLWPSTLKENSINHYSTQGGNYNAIMRANKNYNG